MNIYIYIYIYIHTYGIEVMRCLRLQGRTLKARAIQSFEVFVTVYPTIRRSISEKFDLQQYRCTNFKFRNGVVERVFIY